MSIASEYTPVSVVAEETNNEGLNIQASQEAAESPAVDPLKIQALQTEAVVLWEADQASALELGHALIAVREAMLLEHGAFAKWFREAGMEESRVYYCIRKAEGKVRKLPKEDPPAFHLSRHNFAVAKAAPKDNTAFAGVHVSKHGTTASDVYALVRVSLPPGSPVPEKEGYIPAGDMLSVASRFDNKNPSLAAATIAFGKTDATIKDLNGQTTITLQQMPERPPYEKIIDGKRETLYQVPIRVSSLKKLVDSASDFDAEEILLTFSKGCVRGDMVERGHRQTWLGFAGTSQVSTYYAMHGIPSGLRDAEAEAMREATSKQVEETAE